jgi:Protein of unknown function (DUF3370)
MTSIKFQRKDWFMFPLIASFWIAQTPVTPGPQEILRPQEIRVLPGSLDNVPVFNSNSPELVLKEGILLSTFPPNGKQFEAAHLDRSFSGRFDIFAHHIAKGTPEDLRTLYLGIVAHNPRDVAVTIDILQGASHLSQPDAPFIEMGPFLDNQSGSVYAGPGSRVGSEVLRGFRQSVFPAKITIEARGYALILNQDIPVSTLTPPINGRSALLRLRSDGPVYLASLGKFAPLDAQGQERSPTLEEWKTLLQTGNLSSPRDRVPTPISQTKGNLIYGRVAGVAIGSRWQSITTDPNAQTLAIPEAGRAISYGISLLHRGKLGTGQNQTAKMEKRYPDTAYEAHGNYGVEYNVTLPLENKTKTTQTVKIAIETPLKREHTQQGLHFFEPLPKNVFFRGTVRIRYVDDDNRSQTRYFHLVQRRGQMGEALAVLQMKPGEKRRVLVDLIYPADATPPQVLTVQTAK